ncbi:lipopolysaccharide heptosyltransferase family protein [Flavobacterium agricola]|uniref:Lipopolysaccharide heptosyltransferase family protein n=2 Tax=Flavobacterium agricola TaxID=2870839 RepID=A0ABY6M255_9FLAO|nr:lipopolysaccharide heptosyltransferase family protein [Flavobacterium agricola]
MIGDVLISTLICENIKINNPDYQVHYLVNDNTIPVLENNPYIDRLIVFNYNENKNIFNLLKFAKLVNQEKYDVVIDAYSKLQSWVITYCNDAAQKISFYKKGRTFLYTDNVIKKDVPATNLGLAIENRLALLAPLGIEVVKSKPELYVTEAEKKATQSLFKKHKLNEAIPTIMISLLGSEPSKTYPLNYMAEVVNYVGTHYNVNILFNYFPKQLADAKFVYNSCSKETQNKIFFDLYGNNLREYITIMDQCDLIIGNDGGAINMAKALNKKSFIIFAPKVQKKDWATFEDDINHAAVHLNDYMPNLFLNKKNKEVAKQNTAYYNLLKPELFLNKLKTFLDLNI